VINIFSFTGNPFVDNGIALITSWTGNIKPEEIDNSQLESLAQQISQMYVKENWKKKIQFIFPNGKIANPSIPLNRKSEEYVAILKEYIQNLSTQNVGNCIACGKRDGIFYLTKSLVPLSGSGDYLNFFPSFQSGEKFCGACAFAIQLSVPMLMDCGKFLLFSSHNDVVLLDLAQFQYEKIKFQQATGNFEGIYKNSYSNKQNALFHIIDDIILPRHEEDWGLQDTQIVCYCFSNSNQGAELEIINIPAEVFGFLYKVRMLNRKFPARNISQSWRTIVNNAYYKSKKVEPLDVKTRKHSNLVYDGLLKEKSILSYFCNFSEKKALCAWELVELYLSKVRKMEKQRIDAIKVLADKIVEIMKYKGNTKRLFQMETSKSYSDLRVSLIRCARDWQNMSKIEPLIRLESSEGWKNWRETRDLLLFRIYETSHDWIINNRSEEEREEENILTVEQDGGNKNE